MSVIAACVRVTTKSRAIWRTCTACGVLAPLTPDENSCRACPQPLRSRRTERNRSK